VNNAIQNLDTRYIYIIISSKLMIEIVNRSPKRRKIGMHKNFT